MVYTVEFDIREFPFWSGAKRFVDELRRKNLLDEAENIIIEMFDASDTPPTQTEINDYVWFELEDYMQEIGLL